MPSDTTPAAALVPSTLQRVFRSLSDARSAFDVMVNITKFPQYYTGELNIAAAEKARHTFAHDEALLERLAL